VWWWFLFLSRVSWITGAVKHHSLWQIRCIWEAFIPLKVTAAFNMVNYTPLLSKSSIEMIIGLPQSFVHIWCRQTDLRRSQLIWLQRICCFAHNNAQRTMWEHQILMLEIHREKTLHWVNHWINLIHHRGIVTCLRSHHLHTLPSSTTLRHSTWHQDRSQALVVQHKHIRVMGHRCKDTTSPNVVMVDLKCSPLSNSQGRGPHLQAHLECLQHWLETFQSFSRHLPPYSIRTNSRRTCETAHTSPIETISAGCRTAQDRYCRDCGFANITRDLSWRIRCSCSERLLIRLGRGQRQCPNQHEVNGIPLEAICQKDGAAQL